jgi:hypothetical protein
VVIANPLADKDRQSGTKSLEKWGLIGDPSAHLNASRLAPDASGIPTSVV